MIPAKAAAKAEDPNDTSSRVTARPRKDEPSQSFSTSGSLPRPPRVPEVTDLPAVESPAVDVDLELEQLVAGDGVPIRSAPPSLPPPIAPFGRYELLGRLAVGGMAEIYLARESTQGDATRLVVIKTVRANMSDNPDFERMFLTEGRVAMRLNHPNICHVYEIGKEGDLLFIAMEFVNGVPLRELLMRLAQDGRSLPAPIAVQIAANIAGALQHAHSARDERRRPAPVIHRDISPHNIMVGFDGVVKLLDFGVAKDEKKDGQTQPGTVKGKFGYMAPEQIAKRTLDGRADVFALGVCLWESLTGQRLYKRETEYDTLKAIMDGHAPSIRDVRENLPEELDEIVQKALAADRDDRWASAEDLQDALLEYLTMEKVVASPRRVAALMEEVFTREIAQGPVLEQGPEILDRLRASLPEAPPAEEDASAVEPAAAATGRPRWLVPALAAAAVLLVALIVWAAWPSGGEVVAGPTDAPAPPAQAEPPTPVAEPAVVEPAPTVQAEAPATATPAAQARHPEGETAQPEGEGVEGQPDEAGEQAAEGEGEEAPTAEGESEEAPTAEGEGEEAPTAEGEEVRPEETDRRGGRVRGHRSPGFVTNPGF